MVDFASDSAIFLADSEHTATVAGFDPVAVIYDAPNARAKLYTDEVDTTAPACSMLDEDVARLGIVYETPLTVQKRGVTVGSFTVAAADPDGQGLTRITLTFAEA